MKISLVKSISLGHLIQSSCVVASTIIPTSVGHCNSSIFCFGYLLRDVQLARPFADSKTFVDLPTTRPAEQVLAAYDALPKPLTNNSVLQNFLSENFGQIDWEIGEINQTLDTNATFLDHVESSIIKDFVSQVIGIWPALARKAKNESCLCKGCETSFIAPKRPFVVAGGRFREVYYWDSYFILEGLLRTKGAYLTLAKNTIENFLDFIEDFGFVPNGSRKYYLNRSQPPLLSDMIHIYIEHTSDASVLERALPLLETEQLYWNNQTRSFMTNHTDGSQQSHTLFRYSAFNNQPRPESYLEDYQTVNNQTYHSTNGSTYPMTPLSTSEKDILYANIASGAESGWDYGSRWLKDPLVAAEDNGIPLRSLNTVNIAPIDLQAIQFSNAQRLSQFYARVKNEDKSREWQDIAMQRAEAIQAVHYNATLKGYFDFNSTAGTQQTDIPTAAFNSSTRQFFSPAQFYPLACNATPAHILGNSSLILELYAPVIEQLKIHPGGVAATNLITGQQWDSPNVWAPLQYILIQGIRNSLFHSTGTHDANHAKLHKLSILIAQRFIDSTYCTWRSTGGSHPSLNISRLRTASKNGNGTIFEKYSNRAIDAVGGGGEYSVVPGFGWTNGVIIWMADIFGKELVTPDCHHANAVSSSVNDDDDDDDVVVVEVNGISFGKQVVYSFKSESGYLQNLEGI